MTAMSMRSPALALAPNGDGFWRKSLAASLAVALHGAVAVALMLGWSTERPGVDAPRVMHTQLVVLPAPAPAPTPEPRCRAARTCCDSGTDQTGGRSAGPGAKARESRPGAQAGGRKKLEQQQQRMATEQRNRELEQQRLSQARAAAEKPEPPCLRLPQHSTVASTSP